MKERLGLSSPSSASEPIGCSGKVMPVFRDLPDIKACLATRMGVVGAQERGLLQSRRCGVPTLDLALQNDSLVAAGRKSSSFCSTSTSSVSSNNQRIKTFFKEDRRVQVRN